MHRLLAIADDLSGAAEIAGIGQRFGLPTRLLREPISTRDDFTGLTVLDTDSRSLDAAGASDVVRRFLLPLALPPLDFDLIYKKTDSVFRGQIRAELDVVAQELARPAVILLPQNPSRGRTIRPDGNYFLNGSPLHETDFARDPDHPARSSAVADLLNDPHAACVTFDEPLRANRTSIAVAATTDDVARWAKRVDPRRHLLAGSGDFFTALLETRGLRTARPFLTTLAPGRTLFICGSTSTKARGSQRAGVLVCPMPDDVFRGASADAWSSQVLGALERSPKVFCSIPYALDRSACPRLQTALAELVDLVLDHVSVENLMLEGGATASAVCRAMNWQRFDALGEFAPGVVALSARDQNLIIKPGSYPWPASVW